MTKFYATLDFDETIAENAHVEAFDTRAAAEAYLRAPFSADEWTVGIDDGRFSDCWIKLYSAPDFTLVRDFEPFGADDLIVRAPGQHPGGRQWWIEPRAEILVAILKAVEE